MHIPKEAIQVTVYLVDLCDLIYNLELLLQIL